MSARSFVTSGAYLPGILSVVVIASKAAQASVMVILFRGQHADEA